MGEALLHLADGGAVGIDAVNRDEVAEGEQPGGDQGLIGAVVEVNADFVFGAEFVGGGFSYTAEVVAVVGLENSDDQSTEARMLTEIVGVAGALSAEDGDELSLREGASPIDLCFADVTQLGLGFGMVLSGVSTGVDGRQVVAVERPDIRDLALGAGGAGEFQGFTGPVGAGESPQLDRVRLATCSADRIIRIGFGVRNFAETIPATADHAGFDTA